VGAVAAIDQHLGVDVRPSVAVLACGCGRRIRYFRDWF
jgi:hypothetical protein